MNTCMTNPPALHSWLKPNIHHLSSGSSGPINLLNNVRSSQDIPDVITGTLSTNDKIEKKLNAKMAVVQTGGCMSKSTSNTKVQSTVSSGEPQQAPRRQVNDFTFRLCY